MWNDLWVVTFHSCNLPFVCSHYELVLRFKSLGSVRFFFSRVEINTCIQQGCIKLIKSDSKDMYNEDLFKNKFPQKHKGAQRFTKLFIRNVSWAANQHIRMISEGSCDTEDWSNDAGNSALHHRNNYILKCIVIENSCIDISQYYSFYCDFDQINVVFVRDFFQKHLKITWTPNIWTVV